MQTKEELEALFGPLSPSELIQVRENMQCAERGVDAMHNGDAAMRAFRLAKEQRQARAE